MLLRSTVRALDRLTGRLGFTLIARDYRSPRRRGDIDLIAFEKERLCFIEVKTRTTRKFLPAEAAVDEEKRATLSSLGREILRPYAHAPDQEPAHRFGVVRVHIESNDDSPDSIDVTLFRNAFAMS